MQMYDARGHRVQDAIHATYGPGEYSYDMDMRRGKASHFARGIYFVSFAAGDVSMTRRVLLLRP